MRAGGGFGVVLDGEGRFVFAAKSFVRVVVEIQVCQLDLFFVQRIHIDAEAVILTGDFYVSGFKVLDRVIGSSVAKLELVGLCAECQGKDLVAEAYSEDWYFAEQLADGFDCVINGGRVAGAVA